MLSSKLLIKSAQGQAYGTCHETVYRSTGHRAWLFVMDGLVLCMYNFPRDTKTVSLCFCSKQARSLRHDDQGFPSEDSLVHTIFSTSSYEDSLFLVSGVTVSAIWPQVIGRRLDPIMCSWQGVVSQTCCTSDVAVPKRCFLLPHFICLVPFINLTIHQK